MCMSVLLDLSPEIFMKCDNSNISRLATCLAGVSSTPMSNNTMNPKPPNTRIAMSLLIDSEWKISSDAVNLKTTIELLKEMSRNVEHMNICLDKWE